MEPDLNIPPTTDPVAQRAYDLQEKINDEIRRACLGASVLQWKTLAESVAERQVNHHLWRFEWIDFLGQPPKIVITEYRG